MVIVSSLGAEVAALRTLLRDTLAQVLATVRREFLDTD
jgi:hypothetical protein